MFGLSEAIYAQRNPPSGQQLEKEWGKNGGRLYNPGI